MFVLIEKFLYEHKHFFFECIPTKYYINIHSVVHDIIDYIERY